MQYATLLNKPKSNIDTGFMKYAGWNATQNDSPSYQMLWSDDRLLMYQKQISDLLEGVADRPIIVPVETIGSVLWQCYQSNTPRVGDIYSKDIIPTTAPYRNDTREIVDRAINIIVSQIRTEYEMIANNNKLTVWNSLYGDFNKEGLRAHPPIKIRLKGPTRNMFNMNY